MKKGLFLSLQRTVFAAVAGLSATFCHAQETQPLWELGLGAGVLQLPDYRGSDRSRTYVLPAPYFVYRGEWLKADRGGIRGTFFDNDKVELNLSLNATLPVNSADNPARAGMEDLKPTVEIGPTIDVNLWEAPGGKMKVDFRAPLRSGITVESSPKSIGWLFSPSLNLDIKDPGGMSGWNLGILAGTLFSTRKYNDYFYSVGAADATTSRPAYSAGRGYAGSQLTLALSKRFPKYWVGGFVRYDNLKGAAFDDSPLVKRDNAIWAGFAISWILAESLERVRVED